ncbi:MAG TPA: hypothetical protein VFG69_07450 [Nannocystaceae bacterium]|nr:hypothetical protein [Nannocystaceae bacterium]
MDEGNTGNGSARVDDDSIDVRALLDVATTQIAEQAREHPVRTLGVAFGVGYVLGGGLPRFAVRLAGAALLRTAGRAMLGALPWWRLAEGFVGNTAGESQRATPSNGHARTAARDR